MTTHIVSAPILSKGLLYGFGLAVLWLVLALITSTTTYHLAPPLVAATPVVVDAWERPTTGHALRAVLGVALALIITGILSVSGNLDGPSLLPVGGAALESVVFAIAGGVIGLIGAVVKSRPRAGSAR
ncbi:MAG: hypothetical protein ACC658_05380 [Acidimicrobiia bacterium]